MNVPRDMDTAYYGPWGVGCLWVYFPITSAGLLYLAQEEGEGLVFFAIALTFLCLVFPAGILVWAAKKYTTWKKWAEERGWEEPPRKERAYKKGNS